MSFDVFPFLFLETEYMRVKPSLMAAAAIAAALNRLGLADADLPRGAGVADLLLPVARSLVTNGRSDEFQVQSKSTHLMAFN